MIVISLGAGVQSSTLYRMSATGELPRADLAIFADTQSEPAAVYEHLDILERDHGAVIPIRRMTAGDLGQAILNPIHTGTGRNGQPPFYVKDPPDSNRVQTKEGRLWRQCTKYYKLVPIRRGVAAALRERGEKAARQWIGISLDEAQRMKDSGVRYITNEYPLIDLRMTRHDCLLWLEKHGYPRPPKSACVFCPFTNNARWRDLRDHAPEDWRRAVDFDAALRNGHKLPGVSGTVFVHRSLLPLSEVDISNETDKGQLDLFGNECEGMCGV